MVTSVRVLLETLKMDCHVIMTLAVNRDTTIVDHFDWFCCAVK
jgi:hypothetical protein